MLGWVARQGLAQGLGVVYFNHPQHLEGRTAQQVCGLRQLHGMTHDTCIDGLLVALCTRAVELQWGQSLVDSQVSM